jgi:hypothetical protein
MMGSRHRPIGVLFEQDAQEGYDDIVNVNNTGFFLHNPNLIWSVDFTSTAIRQQRLHTYGAKGGKQSKSTKGNHVYTDNIFTATALHGSIIAPHAFSHNPALMPGAADLGILCQQFGVSPDHVVYCPEATNWVGESADMVYSVVKHYSWKDCYIVHDDGTSWKPGGECIFTEYGALGQHNAFQPSRRDQP